MNKIRINKDEYLLFSEWRELPFNSYIKIANISRKKQDLLLSHNRLLDAIQKYAQDYERIQFDESLSDEQKEQAKSFIEKKTSPLFAQVEKINQQVIDAWIRIVQYMSNIPIHVLVELDTTTPEKIVFLDANWDNVEVPSSHLAYYISLCSNLLSKPIPINKPTECFIWQTATDTEIAELQKQYNELSFLSKCLSVGRKLKSKLKSAKFSKITIPALLSQSTLSNRELMRAYENAQKDIENNNLSGLKTILAILLIESAQFDNEIKEAKQANNLDIYRNAYFATYQRISNILWEQSRTLDCATVFGIAAFFLKRSKTSTNPIKMFFDLLKILRT